MTIKKVFYLIAVVFGLVIIGASVYINSLLPIITGYAAKNLCSDVFVSGREPADVESTDLNFSFIRFVRNTINYKEKSVNSRFLWGKSKAIYRDGFGATLVRDVPEDVLRKAVYPTDADTGYSQDSTKWPLGNIITDTVDTGIDKKALGEISNRLVHENAYNGNAFAFFVVYKGIPVAEEYDPQFNQNTRFLSWSMAKSFINAMVGILVKENKLDIYKPADINEWKGDERSKITINDLMQMQSGLKWNENYGNRSDVTLMLHCTDDMGHYAYDKPLEYPIGSNWSYSSGTTNIVSYLIKKKFDNNTAYYNFTHEKLFEKIGIKDAVFEVDPEGTFVGSSYLYLTARDYARFGLLYLNDGIFNGERILPEGWVKYSTTPASASKGKYGAFFWLNRAKSFPSAPEDMFTCEGHDGQMIFIIPSKQLIVVILGYSPKPEHVLEFDRLLKDLLNTLK